MSSPVESQTPVTTVPATAAATNLAPAFSPAPQPTSSMMSKKAPINKHKTAVQFEISNITSLSDLEKRFNPANPPPEAPTPKACSSYFEKLDIAVLMELDHGTQHIIDVQPDLRDSRSSISFITLLKPFLI
ncbi:hypothetical protein WA026_021518 [Henosepilachna vigintioctopunctata]|uniref:Uncharacterized protein n=1 Tax=Henosepilachna vigintioctopunctata TaxID=420089 RepID=A0AAW1VFA0_9CUCU